MSCTLCSYALLHTTILAMLSSLHEKIAPEGQHVRWRILFEAAVAVRRPIVSSTTTWMSRPDESIPLRSRISSFRIGVHGDSDGIEEASKKLVNGERGGGGGGGLGDSGRWEEFGGCKMGNGVWRWSTIPALLPNRLTVSFLLLISLLISRKGRPQDDLFCFREAT
ncbi:hypothetical protein NEOLEDRAFT_894818 [Neolentinus lepideus HHB14362 ss-1]|uniref:Uncharacterized protein n=1 Tax=Neolentinus lepideus HHB14362 ss-1 TaxID=1314782 RepID=A0A165NSV2_9AGAM|nr:hypothetical protein NEOLEDRAFT_894818 [Neolentinus lepideus HHB14362 ss-1]